MSEDPLPARRRKNDRSEIPVSFLPEGNPSARWSYLCALFGLIPGLGLLLGVPAVLFGVLGRRAALRDGHRRGLGHAVFGGLLGGTEFLCNLAGLVSLAQAGGRP